MTRRGKGSVIFAIIANGQQIWAVIIVKDEEPDANFSNPKLLLSTRLFSPHKKKL